MEREFIVHHIKDDSGLEDLIASMQPMKYSEDYSKHSMKHWLIPEAHEAFRNVFRCTRCLQDSARRARELVRPGVTGLLIGVEYSRVRDSA